MAARLASSSFPGSTTDHQARRKFSMTRIVTVKSGEQIKSHACELIVVLFRF